MHISCPHCNAAYNVGPIIKNAVLVCHRCHTEFNMGDQAKKQQEEHDATTSESSLPLFDHLSTEQNAKAEKKAVITDTGSSEAPHRTKESGPTSSIPIPAFLAGKHEHTEAMKRFIEPEPAGLQELDEESGAAPSEITAEASTNSEPVAANEAITPSELQEPIPPSRSDISIWPWLVVILLVISGGGFWYKQDVWLDHPWVRSVLINLHLPVAVRDKDWVIVPESVQGNWLKRDDGSQVLIIQGRIENRLYCELSPPKILVRFFDESGIDDALEERVMPITEPPSMEKVKHAPFDKPELDRVAVEAQGQRGFFLVLESLPEQAADFSLKPVTN